MKAPRKSRVTGADEGETLHVFISKVFDATPRIARMAIESGAVYVDRARVTEPGHRLSAGARIAMHDTRAVTSEPEPSLVHEDADVVVCDKPAGVPSQATHSSLRGSAEDWARGRWPDARLFHRLDREVTGLLLFTKAARREQFQEWMAAGQLVRRYRGLVREHMKTDVGEITAPIGRDPRDRRRRMVAQHGKSATTRFAVCERGWSPSGRPYSLVDLEILTGRTHQIRVHLASVGHGLVGDTRYATNEGESSGIALGALELAWPGQVVKSALAPAMLRQATDLLP